MSFVDDFDSKRKNNVPYFDFTPGEHKILILDGKAYSDSTHWIKNYKIRCLGENCPVCKLGDEHYPRKTYYVNVFDMTPAKVCPNCNKAVKSTFGRYPKVCPSCETVITDVPEKPINRVVVLNGGKRLFVEQLNTLYNEFGDLREYVVEMLVTGTGRDRQIVVKPSKESKPTMDIPDDLKHDLSKLTLTLTAEEILKLMNENVTLGEILSARNNPASKGNEEKVKKSIESLFSE